MNETRCSWKSECLSHWVAGAGGQRISKKEIDTMAAAAPKLDIKMLAMPAALYFSRSIDFKDPAVQSQWQTIFLSGKLNSLQYVDCQLVSQLSVISLYSFYIVIEIIFITSCLY